MKCEQCKKIIQIDGFGGYLHFTSTKGIMDSIVQKDIYEKTQANTFEIYYKCKVCNTTWVLVEPDFPVKGYLISQGLIPCSSAANKLSEAGANTPQLAAGKFNADEVLLEEILCCPHQNKDECNCKKPKAGLIQYSIQKYDLDIKSCFVVGGHGEE